MKRILVALCALLCASAFGTTLNPIQLLNPVGSASGQAIVSTGVSTAPAWGGVGVNGIAAIAANSVLANATGSSANPTAFAVPSCSTSTSALQWTSGTGFVCTTGLITAATVSSTYAPLASPALTGAPTAPTQAAADNTAKIATDQYVTTAVSNFGANRNQPYFSAFLSANQSFTAGTPTKIAFNTKNFDSGTYYDAVTNFRYTPLIAGKYLVTVQLTAQGVSSAVNQYAPVAAYIYKNGSQLLVSSGQLYFFAGGLTLGQSANITAIVPMNGTTDFLEGWGNVSTVGSTLFNGGSTLTFIQAVYLGP